MSKPKAYEPEKGYRFQLFWRNSGREWESIDYARDRADKNYLLSEYRLAYGCGEFKSIELPRKYWPVLPVNGRKIQFSLYLRSLSHWQSKEVISQGHFFNTVLDQDWNPGKIRVHLSRMSRADGASWNNCVSIEVYDTFENSWVTVFDYDPTQILDGYNESYPFFIRWSVKNSEWFKRYFKGYRDIIGTV